MPREPLNTGDMKIEQRPPVADTSPIEQGGEPTKPPPGTVDRDAGSIVQVDESVLANTERLEQLKFGEDPVTIRIEPSADKNAATSIPVWVNGKGAEVFQRDRWEEITYLPVGRVLTVKRKYVAILAGTKLDTVSTEIKDRESERPVNLVNRVTSALCSFSILEDRNPRGAAWFTELRRRNW